MSLTLCDNLVNSATSLMCHEAEDRENDKAGKDTSTTVDEGNKHSISVKSKQPTLESKKVYKKCFSVLKYYGKFFNIMVRRIMKFGKQLVIAYL